mmetsp:Transcript_38503/g.95383  ORF Transcript_38503/g.95383 Transcript_38503/m.95383 type:complete len:277 (-) Transcript_38503:167-997(-)
MHRTVMTCDGPKNIGPPGQLHLDVGWHFYHHHHHHYSVCVCVCNSTWDGISPSVPFTAIYPSSCDFKTSGSAHRRADRPLALFKPNISPTTKYPPLISIPRCRSDRPAARMSRCVGIRSVVFKAGVSAAATAAAAAAAATNFDCVFDCVALSQSPFLPMIWARSCSIVLFPASFVPSAHPSVCPLSAAFAAAADSAATAAVAAVDLASLPATKNQPCSKFSAAWSGPSGIAGSNFAALSPERLAAWFEASTAAALCNQTANSSSAMPSEPGSLAAA